MGGDGTLCEGLGAHPWWGGTHTPSPKGWGLAHSSPALAKAISHPLPGAAQPPGDLRRKPPHPGHLGPPPAPNGLRVSPRGPSPPPAPTRGSTSPSAGGGWGVDFCPPHVGVRCKKRKAVAGSPRGKWGSGHRGGSRKEHGASSPTQRGQRAAGRGWETPVHPGPQLRAPLGAGGRCPGPVPGWEGRETCTRVLPRFLGWEGRRGGGGGGGGGGRAAAAPQFFRMVS